MAHPALAAALDDSDGWEPVPNFTVVVIARNEEARIGRNLQAPGTAAFLKAGGSVLIADTGSDDKTREVAEAHGAVTCSLGKKHLHTLSRPQAKRINAKFVVPPDAPIVAPGDWYFDFAGARNHASEFAATDMVLHVDTCDMLEALDWRALARMIHNGVTRFTYRHYLGSGTERQSIARFYDRRIDKWGGISHEALSWNAKPKDYVNAKGEPSGGFAQWGVDVPEEMLRVRYFRNANKKRPYFIGMCLDCMADPKSPRWYHYLGREMYYTHRWHSGIKLLLHQADMDTAWKPEKSQSLVHAGECYEGLKQWDKAKKCYWRAHDTDPGRREPFIRLADLYRKQWIALPPEQADRRHDCLLAAVSASKAALQIPNTTALSENEGNYREYPHDNLYWALSWLGRRGKAKYHCKRALAYAPHVKRYSDELATFQGVDTDSDTDLRDDEV